MWEGRRSCRGGMLSQGEERGVCHSPGTAFTAAILESRIFCTAEREALSLSAHHFRRL